MSLHDKEFTILHVEDDPILVKLVRTAFENFGFRGTMISAGTVDQAIELLQVREQNREPVNLILVDMQLPDGTGLDVIREVKTTPTWRITPVIVLSSELAVDTINSAYALGANCYISKIPKMKNVFESLRALYANWLENALLPQVTRDRLQDVLSRGVHLRARTAEFYVRLAQFFDGKPEMGFWLDRSLNEGNLSNLLAFLQPKVTEKDAPPETIDRLVTMQTGVSRALKKAEESLQRTPAPHPEEVYRWVLDFISALDEEVIAEGIGCLFPKGPEAITALRIKAADQLKEMANHILERTKEPDLRRKAGKLFVWAEQIAVSAPLAR